MTQWAILYPVFIQVALTFGLMFSMGIARVEAIKTKEVSMGDLRKGDVDWPQRPMLFGNAFRNQSELPILFYAVVAFTLLAGKVDFLSILLAWVFVGSRLAHAYVHIVVNDVAQRFYLFLGGSIVLLLMWLNLALRLIFQGGPIAAG